MGEDMIEIGGCRYKISAPTREDAGDYTCTLFFHRISDGFQINHRKVYGATPKQARDLAQMIIDGLIRR